MGDGNIVFYEVFEKEIGGANFLRTVKALYCRPNSLGRASDVWPLQVLVDYFIQFCDAPFPNGFPPPLAIIEAVPYPHPLQLPTSPIDQDFSAHISISSVPPSVGPSWDTDTCDAHNNAASPVHDYPVVISTAVRDEIFSPILRLSQLNSVSFDEYLSEYASIPPSVGPSWLGETNHTSFMATNFHVDDSFSYPPMTTSVQIEESLIPSESNAIIIEQFPITSSTKPTMVVHQALVWKGADNMLNKDFQMNIYRSLKKTNWGRPMLLTRNLYLGRFWVGLDNPFDFSEELGCKLITNSLLAVIDLDETTLQDLIDNPLILNSSKGSATVGWNTLRQTLAGYLDNRCSELCKIVRACILNDTGFSHISEKEQNARADHFLGLLCSPNVDTVQQGIIEILELQMFREILFTCLFQPIIGLAKDNQSGRIADLFPEEVRDQRGLCKGVVGTLLTIIYHTLLCWRSTNSQGRKLSRAYVIIMSALTDMYKNQELYPRFKEAVKALPFISAKNVFPMHPKELAPRTCLELGQAKRKDEVSTTIIQISDKGQPAGSSQLHIHIPAFAKTSAGSG
ncbi:hypothetical protein BDR05DRAFT_997154 [Suillus weaverae]|nr:hypothetical protein BDR05DRAFT_997154 [Suillus weaverae]